MRIMGLDYGSKTVGVAVSDELELTAEGIEIIRRKEENKLRRTLARIEELVKEYNVATIVLGFPLHYNGDVGERAEIALQFKDKLETRTGCEVIMQDERLTTVEAEEIMHTLGIPLREYRNYVDMIAAKIILEDYLHERELKNR